MERIEQFRMKMHLVARELSFVVGKLIKSPNLAEVYKDYMIVLYGMMTASEKLLQVAAEESARRFNGGDASCAGLSAYFLRHKKEEANHDKWLLEDLASIGVSAEQMNRRPSVDVAALVGSQYYWIHHCHPAALLGYCAILESYPMGSTQIDEWRALTGHPDSAFRTLREHARLDPYHATELDDMIVKIAMHNAVFDVVSISMVTSCGYIGQVFNGLIEQAQAKTTPGVDAIMTEDIAQI